MDRFDPNIDLSVVCSMPTEPFNLYYAFNVWPAACAHCGMAPTVMRHVCEMAVVDWVWAIDYSRRYTIGTLAGIEVLVDQLRAIQKM
jgi:hypothetical protein